MAQSNGLAFNSAISGPKGNAADSAKKRRAGLMKAIIGSTHLVKGKDGKTRSFIVREYSQYKDAKVIARCLYCRKDWDTAEQLVADHPAHGIMVKQSEPHVYVLWSNDPIEPPDPNAPKGKPVDEGKVIGFLSDEHGVES